ADQIKHEGHQAHRDHKVHHDRMERVHPGEVVLVQRRQQRHGRWRCPASGSNNLGGSWQGLLGLVMDCYSPMGDPAPEAS
ncbi:MAG: hypothetical protein WCL59_11795, partial [Cyanobium sp. ELA507]